MCVHTHVARAHTSRVTFLSHANVRPFSGLHTARPHRHEGRRHLLDMLLVPGALHGFGPPSLLFLTHVILEGKVSDESTPRPGPWNNRAKGQAAGSGSRSSGRKQEGGDSYHKIGVCLPVVGSPVILGDGHGVACRRFPHLEGARGGFQGPQRPTDRRVGQNTQTLGQHREAVEPHDRVASRPRAWTARREQRKAVSVPTLPSKGVRDTAGNTCGFGSRGKIFWKTASCVHLLHSLKCVPVPLDLMTKVLSQQKSFHIGLSKPTQCVY